MSSIAYRLVVAIFVAIVVSSFYVGSLHGKLYLVDLNTALVFAFATIITALLSGMSIPTDSSESSSSASSASIGTSDSDREEGTVKWFNVSKGFGFITRQNGEEIFVHYRSIRGEGRRRLYDGQEVEFCVVDSEKGLQAEEVEILS